MKGLERKNEAEGWESVVEGCGEVAIVVSEGTFANGEIGVVNKGVSGRLLMLLLVSLMPLANARLCGWVSGRRPYTPSSGFGQDEELVFEFDGDEAEGTGDAAVSGPRSGSISIPIISRSNPEEAFPVAAIFDVGAGGIHRSEGPSASARERSVIRVGIF